ncbi:MAG: tRNA (guanosine(46)-N7)-methyltransferase TrmB [Nocardioides sp.]
MTTPDPARATPARPHHQLTADGRVMREVLSYARRGNRLVGPQQASWDAHASAWLVPEEAFDEPGFDPASYFDREAELIVEIGGGMGESTAALAVANPDANILGFEVWRPGVAETFGRLAKIGATNVRMCMVDAAWTIRNRLAPDSVSLMTTFFPDPWHKSRHHKRRIVNLENAAGFASRLAPGGVWRLATDWPEYAEQMVEVLDAVPTLSGGLTDRWDGRPLTKFERKGIRAGRPITDLAYLRA